MQSSFGGGTSNAFVGELSTDGSTMSYLTYLGGSGQDLGNGIALDTADNAYVVGTTSSTDFPTTTGAYQTALGGTSTTNAFVAKLNSTGTSLDYSTYVGATGVTGNAIGVDVSGQAYITGAVGSHALVDALNAAGSTLVYATSLAGSSTDVGYGIAVTASGQATVTGSTTSTDFPTTSDAFQTSLAGVQDAYISQFSATGTLTYSTYMGGATALLIITAPASTGYAVAVSPTGTALVVGTTNTIDFPTSSGAFQTGSLGHGAFVAELLPGAVPPLITSISPDTGSSATDQITSSQNLYISGTATPSTTVTLERVDLGVLGTAAVSSAGTWTYDYTGTTLAQGTYDFIARDTDGAGATSLFSPDFLVTVETNPPTVTASVLATTTTLAPQVHVTASDLVGVPANATVTLDVDLLDDDTFTDTGDMDYATGTLVNGQATITLPTLPATGTYRVEANVENLAGVTGTSAAQTFVVTAATAWTGATTALSVDPVQGDWQAQLGDVSQTVALDLDQSPGTSQSGNPALVYHSSQVAAQPIVQVQLDTPNNASLPSSISAQLTFDGVAAATVTYYTAGDSPGDVLTMALQSSTTITTTGRYSYSVDVTAGSYSQTFTGSEFVVAEDASTLGAGWTFSGVDQLIPISASGSLPAGVLRVYGNGGYRFYTGTSTFTSPAGDNGTLTLSGGTYTYSTPDGQSWTFNSSGYMTQWTSADGQETLQYSYDGSDRLSGITAIDGAVTTFSYSSGQVVIETVNSRTTTLTLDGSNNLTEISTPDGGVQTMTYDANQHLTSWVLGVEQQNWSYSSAGVFDEPSMGLADFQPAVTQGLSALVAGVVYASNADPYGNTQQVEVDSQGRPLVEIAANGGVTTMTYSNGFPTSETDPLGRTTTYTLDSLGYVTLETLPDGSTITYQYQSAFHALTTMTDERGDTTTYAYDVYGHMTGETDALGNHTTYTYLSNGLLQSMTDALNHTTTYSYDSDRRLISVTDALGNTTTETYDANGNPQTVTDALGRVSTTVYDVMGRRVNTIDPLGGTTTTTYDVSGLEVTSTNELGITTGVSGQSVDLGNGVESVDGVGSAVQLTTLAGVDIDRRLTSVRDATGSWSFEQYNSVGEVVGTTDALGNTTQSDYDLAGQLIATRDAMGHWTTYTNNTRGEEVTSTDNAGNVTTMAYDADGNLIAVTDPLGHTTSYTYDVDNRQTVVEDPLDNLTTTTYDVVGNVLTVTSPNGNVTSYSYDADNRVNAETTAAGTSVAETSSQTFDVVGNVMTTTDPLGNVTTYTYNADNEQTTITDPLNHTTTLTYNVIGEVLTTTNALNQTTTYVYDVQGRQIATINPLGAVTTMVLDGNGATAATIDPNGNVTVDIINPLGQNVGSINALGNVTQVVRDPDGGVRAVIDPDGNETDYVLDADGRVVEAISPTGTTSMAYDAAGRLASTTDADERVVNYSYDADNRLIGEVWLNSSAATVNLQTFTYDNNGNLLTAADDNGTVTYTYDAQDRVHSYTDVWGLTLTYTYNGNDQVTQRTDSLGGTLTNVYDNASRLTSEQFSGTGATGTVVRVDFGYDAANEQTSITWYSNLAGTSEVANSAYTFDAAGNELSIVNTDSSSTVLSAYTYTYDSGNRVTSQQHWSEVGTVVYSGTNSYIYDATNQLLSDGTATYSYDANGNRTMAGYATGTNNELTNDGTYTYTYDAAGNLIEKSEGAGEQTWYYTYDNLNEMISARETSDGTTNIAWTTFTYDVMRNRVAEQDWTSGSGSTITRFAIASGNVWMDLDGSNNPLVRYLYGAGVEQILTRTVASGANAGPWAYFTDNEGSVRDLANWSGQVQDHLDYSGFGVLTESNPSVGDQYTYTGGQLQKTIGLQLNGARQYASNSGRWTSEDPLMFLRGGPECLPLCRQQSDECD